MSRPITEPSAQSDLTKQGYSVKQLQRRPASGAGCPWVDVQSGEFENGWDNVAFPFQTLRYRLCQGRVDIDGFVEGGTDCTVVFNLPVDSRPDADDIIVASDKDGGVVEWQIDSYTGDVTLCAAGGGGGSIDVSLPINLTNPSITTDPGNSWPDVRVFSGGDFGGWTFKNGVEGIVYGSVLIPPGYSSGGVVYLLFGAQASTGTVRLSVGTRRVAVGGTAYDPVSFTAITAQNISIGTVKILKDASFTIATPPAAGELLLVQILREGNNGNDNLADTLLLFGAWLKVTLG